MTNDVTAPPADRKYQVLVDKMVDLMKTGTRRNIETYYRLGSMYAEFVDGLPRCRYGEATVQTLCDDLKARGVMSEYQRPDKVLYAAKNLVDFFPEVATLMELVDRGFTVSHAKRLFCLDDASRRQVQSRMIVDGAVVSTRDLDGLCREVCSHQALEAVQQVSFDTDDVAEQLSGAVSDGQTTAPAAKTAPRAKADEAPASPAAVVEEPTKASKEKNTDKHQTTPTVPKRTVASPLKVVTGLERLVTKANVAFADVVIAVKETARIGFDSDVAQARYLKALANLLAALSGFTQAAPELLSLISAEQSAANIPTEG